MIRFSYVLRAFKRATFFHFLLSSNLADLSDKSEFSPSSNETPFLKLVLIASETIFLKKLAESMKRNLFVLYHFDPKIDQSSLRGFSIEWES